jgi:N-acetyl-anhydromuramyl-L-alanine amidase AmpD
MATTYRQGSKGAIVKQIQKVVGAYPDGIWGAVTTECVRRWQVAHGLTADGIVGMKTLAKMGLQATAQAVTPSAKASTIEGPNGIVLKKSRRRIDYIAVHCTATREGQAMTVEQIRTGHKAQGWSDIGDHYVVTLDGRVHLGRDVDVAGAHVSGYNSNSIGISYVGGLENRPGVPYNRLKAKDTRTKAQKNALLNLLMDLRKLYPYAKIQGHRDFSPDRNGNGTIEPEEWIKACPSFDAKTEYRMI